MNLKLCKACIVLCGCLLAAFAHPQEAVNNSEPLDTATLLQGQVVFGKVPPGSRVSVGDRRVKVTSEGDFVFGIGRDHKGPVTLTVKSPSGEHQYSYPVEQRTYKIQRIEGVEQKYVSPPQEVLDRIAREALQVRQARTLNDARDDFLQKFIWPLTGPVTGVYGSQRVYNGVPKSPHYGLDIAAPEGTPVVAPAAGVITLASPDLYYSGGTVILDHGHGLSSTFIHLHKVHVAEGDVVTQGQVIAEVGATGRVTGPHLDWRMNWFGERVDPALLMADTPMPETPPVKHQ